MEASDIILEVLGLQFTYSDRTMKVKHYFNAKQSQYCHSVFHSRSDSVRRVQTRAQAENVLLAGKATT